MGNRKIMNDGQDSGFGGYSFMDPMCAYTSSICQEFKAQSTHYSGHFSGLYLQLPNLRKWGNIYLWIKEPEFLLLIRWRVQQIQCSLAAVQTYRIHSIHLGSSGPATMGHGSKRKNETYMFMLMLPPVQWIIKSFVSDAGAPYVFCQFPQNSRD